MKKIFLFFLVLSLQKSFSQVFQRNILSQKYTLQDISANLESYDVFKPYPLTSQEWRSKLTDTEIEKLISAGEEALNYEFLAISGTISMDFLRSGDRERHSAVSFTKRDQLMRLIIAESIEDKGRFTEAIFNGVWSICEESYWGVPAHIRNSVLPDVDNPVVDLFAAESASVLALADYFIGKKLDDINPLIRKRIYSETNKRIFTPMLTKSENYVWMSKTKPVNNWNPWIMSNWILSTLLLERNENKRVEMIYSSMKGLDLYLNSLGEDGGCDEGPLYWFAAGASVFDCLELLQKATNNKVNIYDHPLIYKMGTYVYKLHIDGHYSVNFADADPILKPDGLILYRFGKSINDNHMKEYGKWAFEKYFNLGTTGFMRMRRVENLLTLAEIKNLKSDYKPVKDSWIGDIEVITGRTDKGLYLAAHGGHNAESHNHNDVGDFIVYLEGQPMIIDAGRGNYTARTFSGQRYELWFTRSEYHNLPIINGLGQKNGRDFEAKKVSSTINDKEVSLTMNIENAYEKSTDLKFWRRKVKLNRTENMIELTDNYEFSKNPKSIEQVFITICQVRADQKGKIILIGDDEKRLEISYDPKKWEITKEYCSTDGMEYQSFKTKWNNKPITRIILKDMKPSIKGIHTFDIKPSNVK